MTRECWKVALLVIALLAPAHLYSQVDTGSISGIIKDASGAVVPGAKVTLTNEGTSLVRLTTSSGNGGYAFSPVTIGTYTITAGLAGFQTVVRAGITVSVQQQAVVNFTLQPGQVSQSVTVTGATQLLQTQNASVGQVIGATAINNLPLNGRNYFFLAQLTTGVTSGQQDARGENSNGRFSANGTRPTDNNYILDGADDNTTLIAVQNGHDFVVRPPVDAIEEFKVQTNNYSAEFGRAAGAVLNATLKSGTNKFHGDLWEFLRNDKLDAADFFENAANKKKGEFRQNQFGVTAGGPLVVPHLYDGKNKTFIFGDYEATRIRQGNVFVSTVPTAAERASGFTDFSSLLAGQSGSRTDALGRSFASGTIFDPATTRLVTAGQMDPVSGIVAAQSGYVRDPFQGNIIPQGRLDPNAIKLLNLLPAPNGPGIFNNYTSSPVFQENVNSFDVRVDQILTDRDQVFVRYSFRQDNRIRPGPFPGFADGSDSLNDASLNDRAQSAVASWTRTFSPTVVNVARAAISREHALFLQPFGNQLGIPEQFGIQGVPQVAENGGLPRFDVGSITRFGSFGYIPSDKTGTVPQFSDDFTKVFSKHTVKAGFQYQHVIFAFIQPPQSRGLFNFSGVFTSVPNKTDSSTGIAQMLLQPIGSTVANGVDNVGGANQLTFSPFVGNVISRNYYGGYFQDDWKLTPKLTLNLGVRWDYFGVFKENNGAEANFLPAANGNQAQYLIPSWRQETLSSAFLGALANDGIALVRPNTATLGTASKDNFSPRFGLAYSLTPKLVVRGGYGIFFGGFEAVGGQGTFGNFPFRFSLSFFNPDPAHPIQPDNSLGLIGSSLANIPLSPGLVPVSGIGLGGVQYNFNTPYYQDYNLMLQYELTPNDTVSLGYVASLGRHLVTGQGTNQVTQILPPGTNIQPLLPYPSFARNPFFVTTNATSNYNSLQANYERRFSNGLSFLTNFAWGKVLTDQRDTLENTVGGYRSPGIPGFGIMGDYGLADFNASRIFHFSGSYELPLGHGKRFMTNAGGFADAVLGDWSFNWIWTMQDGQPFTIPCSITTAAGSGCNALLVPGQSLYAATSRSGGDGRPDQFLNPAAFANAPAATAIGQTNFAPLGGSPSQVSGPPFRRFDFSIFKQFRVTEKTHAELRAEIFNLTNTPNFALPSQRNFTDATNFGKITATRDNPNDPREIQFALKFYW